MPETIFFTEDKVTLIFTNKSGYLSYIKDLSKEKIYHYICQFMYSDPDGPSSSPRFLIKNSTNSFTKNKTILFNTYQQVQAHMLELPPQGM
jgi:hypothetical protein